MAKDEHGQPLENIIKVAEAISQGDFSQEATITATTEGLIGELALKINDCVRNLRDAFPGFTEATDKTPELTQAAKGISELMEGSTQTVLDSADKIIENCEQIEGELGKNSPNLNQVNESVRMVKSHSFEIISSQSYQDNARQQLAKMEEELSQIRDSLLDAMIVMNLRSEGVSPQELNNKRKQLHEEAQTQTEKQVKQDLVDDLLAEFGL